MINARTGAARKEMNDVLKMLTAFTREIDEVDDAVAEILEQLDMEHTLRGNSLGILTCHEEFLDAGVVKALCDRLPFDVIGGTTLETGMGGEVDSLLLGISVLTSDDVSFATAYTDPLGDELSPIERAYGQAAAALPEAPRLVFTFLPLSQIFGGELMLGVIDKASGGVPVFGTVACDNPGNPESFITIYNGESSRDRVAIAVASGEIHPRFLIAAITEKKIQRQRAVITESDGSLLMQVNDMPALAFMKELGLTVNDGIEGMSAIPFIVDYNDGAPAVARAMYMVTPEGYIICGAAMPAGATLAIGSIDAAEVLLTAEQAATGVKALGDIQGVLLFSCLSRIAVLGMERTKEIDVIEKYLGQVPYHMAYSGGEICPVYGAMEGEQANRFHNFTIIACVL